MPRYFIVAGFDFGTSFSKVVLREQNTGNSVVVRFNGRPDGLLPSVVGYDGTNFLPPSEHTECYQIPYLKMLAAHVATGTALSDAPIRLSHAALARAGANGNAFIRELLAFYFAHVFAAVRHFINIASPWEDFNFTPGNTEDHLIFQMAVPTGLLASDGKAEQFFREALVLGHELSGHADPMLATPTPASKWSEYVKGVDPLSSDTMRRRYQWQCLIYPEVAAAVQTIFRSRNARDGLYITMDAGAGTVDMNAFRRNTGQHLPAYANAPHNNLLDYYAASVEPLGVHNLDDPHHAVNLLSADDLAKDVKQAIWALYLRALKFQPNHGNQAGQRTWDRATLLLFGGGALHWIYPQAFCRGLAEGGINDPQITRLPIPDHLDSPPETDVGRFFVAYGMSFPRFNLDEVRLPHELRTFNQLFPPEPEGTDQPEPIDGMCRASGCTHRAMPGEFYCYDHID
jgi:hypothetical protein